MSAMFTLSSETIGSTNPGGNSGDDNNEAYVEIILDIFENSVEIHSILSAGREGTLLEDPELSSLAKKTLENRSSSLIRNTSSHIKQAFRVLKRLTSRRFDQKKSAAARALKGLKLIG